MKGEGIGVRAGAMNVLRAFPLACVLMVGSACATAGPAEVTVGDQTVQMESGELQQDVMQFGNALCFVMFLGGALSIFAVIAVLRYIGAERRSSARTSSTPQVAVGQQGVLTLQFLLSTDQHAAIQASLPGTGEGAGSLAALARILSEHRGSWQGVAARGSTLMENAAAVGEAARIVSLFETRASQAGGGQEALLLTAAVHAPFDYSGVMPADMDGFSTVLSKLYDVPYDVACGYQLGWTGVRYDNYDAVVPGVVSV